MTVNNKKETLWFYQHALALVAVFVFFTNLDIHLSNIGIGPPPKFAIAAFVAASIPLLTSFSRRQKFLSSSLILWCFGYLVVTLISFLFVTPSDAVLKELNSRFLAISFLLASLLVFSQYSSVQKITRQAIAVAMILGVFNNIYELFQPPTVSAINQTGRPAGFYENPNMAACGLLLGLIFSIGIIQPRYRILFSLVAFVGILLTFSRGGILSWFIIVTMLSILRIIPRTQLLGSIFLIGILSIILPELLGNIGLNETLQDYGVANDNITQRLLWFQGGEISESSATDPGRLNIVSFAWKKFFEKPLFGYGLAYTQEWEEPIGPHNQYLLGLVEHGLIGGLLFPLFVFASICCAYREIKSIGWIFMTFILLWGIFSHNLMEERYVLITFALMAEMSTSSWFDQKRSKEQNA